MTTAMGIIGTDGTRFWVTLTDGILFLLHSGDVYRHAACEGEAWTVRYCPDDQYARLMSRGE